ncbi:hypothetical protein PHLGIDRAFT_20547 [Phlebiopsis gigantea 11061_1 CR5-6]|uniref:Uncharacterized protein n=1 Tax=Phlebiopsis gigantea (strain 11061_1 CR5-6) TaxID=745531 RepID=A0A0C3RZQ9_PHLG1|nr:hypothetical protein PHLGIDRAFT_20547 [Phlebiopsis gigantea 11061_1 CR5-6]
MVATSPASYPPPQKSARKSTVPRSPRSIRCVNIVVVGNSSVGKSWLSHRFAKPDEELDPNIAATLGHNTVSRDMTIEGQRLNVLVWDTAGSEQFRAITPSYYRRADGALLVYDITDTKSFEALPSWFADVRKYAKENVSVVIVGHKLDKESDRRISYQQGHRYAQEQDCPFFEASAATTAGVEDAFQALLKKVAQNTDVPPQPESIPLNIPQPPTGGCRC